MYYKIIFYDASMRPLGFSIVNVGGTTLYPACSGASYMRLEMLP